jgi:hypothetical protein
MKTKNIFSIFTLFAILLLAFTVGFSQVIKQGGKTYIKDRKGEKWEITQAVSIGFSPYYFQYGLGRNAFSPLDDRHLRDATKRSDRSLRVLGVQGENESKAFSIKKLKGHEIANSSIGNIPIAAAY